jgi:beta-mannosidase
MFGCTPQNPELMTKLEIKSNWTFRQAGENEWLPAAVPGTVHTDLLSNGKIEDPFYRLNEHDVQWIDKANWEYKTTFTVDDTILDRDRIELEFKGLDTYADIFLNGKKLLSADNMFREWKTEVKRPLKMAKTNCSLFFVHPLPKE